MSNLESELIGFLIVAIVIIGLGILIQKKENKNN